VAEKGKRRDPDSVFPAKPLGGEKVQYPALHERKKGKKRGLSLFSAMGKTGNGRPGGGLQGKIFLRGGGKKKRDAFLKYYGEKTGGIVAPPARSCLREALLKFAGLKKKKRGRKPKKNPEREKERPN